MPHRKGSKVGEGVDGSIEKFIEPAQQKTSEVTNSDLKKLMTSLFDKFESSVNERIACLEKTVEECSSNVKKDFLEIRSVLQSHDDRITELEGRGQQYSLEKMDDFDARLKEMEEHIIYQEQRSRKYNLLFYGLDKKENESTTDVVKDCLQNILHISAEVLDTILIQNAHRIPRNPNNAYKSDAPEAIIVKFGRMADRNFVLSRCRQTPMPKGKAIRTDLPGHLKKKRGELAGVAYNLRKSKHMKTRIVEMRNDVYLEFRTNKEGPWQKYIE